MKLIARDIKFHYPRSDKKLVLDGFNLEAESGSYWCLAGPNGSGKSTFLRLACGLLPLSGFSGELTWDDKAVTGLVANTTGRLELAKMVSFVPSTLKTRFPISVEEFVVQGRYARASMWSEHTLRDKKVAEEAIEQIGIASLSEAMLDEISAGEVQLALIARALAQEPRALVLDETTSNLDLNYQSRVFDLLARLNRDRAMTVIVVSHDLNLATEFCPNVCWLHHGKNHAQGAMETTLTKQLLEEIYGSALRVEVGKNPYTGRPKVFYM